MTCVIQKQTCARSNYNFVLFPPFTNIRTPRFEKALARLDEESVELRKEIALAPKFTQFVKEGRVVLWTDESGITDLGIVCGYETQAQTAPGTVQMPRLYLFHIYHPPPGGTRSLFTHACI